MSPRNRACVCIAVLPLWMAWISPASAELWLDPEPSQTWRDMLACPLVVVAQYESHEDNQLVLKVVEVLKGKHDPARPLEVRLEHLYSIETRPVGWEGILKNKEDDGIPRLCYKRQIVNPGELVPMAVRSDARQRAIYFFRDAERPALKVRCQVQSPHFVKGWQQALNGQPMDLLFRLTQDVNSDLSRDALEELGASRDPACLDQLFEWIINLPPEGVSGFPEPVTWLARLGDHEGDVYDRALAPLASSVPGKNEYRFWMLGSLAAKANAGRALSDLPPLLNDRYDIAVRRGALAGLQRIPKREAAQLALDSLTIPELADHAAWGIVHQLQGDDDDRFGNYRGLGDDEWLLNAVRAALKDDRVPESAKKRIQEQLSHRLTPPEPLDLEAYRRNVLDPQDRTYHGWADGATANMHRRAKELCDPSIVPILVEALDVNPHAAARRSYALPEVLCHYATICPRTVRKELEGRKLPARLAVTPFGERNHKVREVMELAGIWMPEGRRHVPEIDQCFELAQQVRRGDSEQLEALLAITDGLFARRQGYEAFPSLLECGSPAARKRFLEYVHKAKEGSISPRSHERHHFELTSILYALHPNHREMHHEIVVELLQSKSLSLRRAGVGALSSAWQCDFDFDPLDLEAVRTRKLAEVEPVLAQISGASEAQARLILLARAGFVVAGEPNESWLPTLVEAVGHAGNAAPHALRLVETIVGQQRARMFQHFPPEQRKRALQAYLQDLGKLENHIQP